MNNPLQFPFDFTEQTNAAGLDQAAAQYASGLLTLLSEKLKQVIELRHPGVLPVFAGEQPVPQDNPDLLLASLQAWGIWFQLLNIAEENTGMRRRRVTEKAQGLEHVPGAFANVIAGAKEAGFTHEQIQNLLDQLKVTPTITAHPTEAKRVTVLQIHRRIYVILYRLEATRWTAREREHLEEQLRDEIDLLWLTGELRIEKPSVDQEVLWGLHFFEQTLYDRVPETLERLDWALEQYYPGETFTIPPFFRFGSWIGGDRDGNPFVTNTITREALLTNRRSILQHYLIKLTDLTAQLSISDHAVNAPEKFLHGLQAMLDDSGHRKNIEKRNPREIFRQFVIGLMEKIENTRKKSTIRSFQYQTADQFINDLKILETALVEANCSQLAKSQVRPLRRQAEAFRFCTARLDVRENSTITTNTLVEIWRLQNKDSATPDTASVEWLQWIQTELSRPMEEPPRFSFEHRQSALTYGLFQLIVESQRSLDKEAIGGFVLSMTRSAADILGVYLLAKYGGLFADSEAIEYCALPVIPLFETIDDLRAAPRIMNELLNTPVVRRSVKEQGGTQEVMIGYSDSNKDGGFLTANYELSRAQAELTKTSRQTGIPIVFFHGRGGSVSRGGAPTGRAIAAQPAGSVNGKLRITEQGEVVSSKYANHGTAQYQMELLTASVMEHTVKSSNEDSSRPNHEHDQALDALSNLAYTAYRQLAEEPGLIDYYNAASPVKELGKLKIGSRPDRRFGSKSLDDLRAIPWVFAWTQNRHHVPAWFGLGAAIDGFIKVRGEEGKALLMDMYEGSPLFRLIVDEVEKSLAFVDVDVMQAYADLLNRKKIRKKIHTKIVDEYNLSKKYVLMLTGEDRLAERFTRFTRKIGRRGDILKQVGLVQVELVKRFREEGKHEDLIALLLSINCISAGLGWTG